MRYVEGAWQWSRFKSFAPERNLGITDQPYGSKLQAGMLAIMSSKQEVKPTGAFKSNKIQRSDLFLIWL